MLAHKVIAFGHANSIGSKSTYHLPNRRIWNPGIVGFLHKHTNVVHLHTHKCSELK